MKAIQLSFNFDNIQEAQEFLGKLGVSADPKSDPLKEVKALAEKYNEETKKERKPRSDAGQPRGPYKKREQEEVVEEAAAPTPVATPPAAPEAAAPAAPAALTIADVRAAMTGRTTEKNIALLKKFGYAKSSELPQEKYADFIAAAKRGE